MAAREVVETCPTQAVSMRDMIGSRSMPPREGRAMAVTSLIVDLVSDERNCFLLLFLVVVVVCFKSLLAVMLDDNNEELSLLLLLRISCSSCGKMSLLMPISSTCCAMGFNISSLLCNWSKSIDGGIVGIDADTDDSDSIPFL